jgi:3-phenylpropionate/cinnamic acid dioxygenase small subunit
MDGAAGRDRSMAGAGDGFLQGAEVEDMALRVRVEDFMADYAHAIDDGDMRAWPRFFAEDARYKIVIRENFEAGLPMGVMYCEGAGMMRDRVMALETANIYEPHTYSHVLGRPRMKQATNGEIHARTNFLVTRTMQEGRMDTYAAGKYLDRIALQADGGLRFGERLVVLDSRRIDILLVFPL